MKKIYTILLLTISSVCMKATSYTVTISGFAYTPSTLNVLVGDVVTISASGTHPLAEVSQTTWNANGTSTVSTGFGNKTSAYTFTITAATNIYYVCTNHVASMQMKGQIVVGTVGVKEQNDAIGNINLFPNPAKDHLNLELNNTSYSDYAIYDTQGKLIKEEKNINLKNSIDLVGINSGLYSLKLSTKSGQFENYKFVVE